MASSKARSGWKESENHKPSIPLPFLRRIPYLRRQNNYQNEELTFKIATGNDWWFHAKGIPGSHVIVKSEGKELPTAPSKKLPGWLPTIPRDGKMKKLRSIMYRKSRSKSSGRCSGICDLSYELFDDGDAVESAGRTAIIMPPEKDNVYISAIHNESSKNATGTQPMAFFTGLK